MFLRFKTDLGAENQGYGHRGAHLSADESEKVFHIGSDIR